MVQKDEQLISKYVTYGMLTNSQSAKRLNINNNIPEVLLPSAKLWCINIYDKIVDKFKKKPVLSSFFRSKELNKKTPGSSLTSQHTKAEAGDIDADGIVGITNKQIFDFIKDELDFDQLIWEHGTKNNPDWVHCSFKLTGNRKQVLKAFRVGNLTKYETYK